MLYDVLYLREEWGTRNSFGTIHKSLVVDKEFVAYAVHEFQCGQQRSVLSLYGFIIFPYDVKDHILIGSVEIMLVFGPTRALDVNLSATDPFHAANLHAGILEVRTRM